MKSWQTLGAAALCLSAHAGCSAGSEANAGGTGSSAAGGNSGGAATAGDSGSGAASGTGASSTGGGTSGGGTASSSGGAASGSGGATDESVYQPQATVPIEFQGGGSFFHGEDGCDGIDNDNNGIVDDVDVGQDGICDCLRIATLGRIGVWGSGNVFTAWLNSRGAQAAADLGDQVLTDALLAPYRVLVALDVSTVAVRSKGVTYPISHVYSAAEASALESWIRGGGGIMTTSGQTSNESVEVVNINSLLAFSGMAYSTTLLGADGDVLNWVPHPITSGMGVAFTKNGVEPATAVGQTLGWDTGNHVALQVHTIDDGRIAMWSDEWITYDYLWNNSTDLDIELLWLNLLEWLTPPEECQVPIPPIVH